MLGNQKSPEVSAEPEMVPRRSPRLLARNQEGHVRRITLLRNRMMRNATEKVLTPDEVEAMLAKAAARKNPKANGNDDGKKTKSGLDYPEPVIETNDNVFYPVSRDVYANGQVEYHFQVYHRIPAVNPEANGEEGKDKKIDSNSNTPSLELNGSK